MQDVALIQQMYGLSRVESSVVNLVWRSPIVTA